MAGTIYPHGIGGEEGKEVVDVFGALHDAYQFGETGGIRYAVGGGVGSRV